MKKLGKYELLEQLGKDSLGTVFRARDVSLDREVAIKILHPQLMVDETFIERFRKDVKTFARLDHPNIVPIFELGETDGHVFIAMKHLPGGSLAQLIEKQKKLGWEQTKTILREVCAGLQSGHKTGLVHQDINPSNILFDAEGKAVLSDFGLAQAVQTSGMSASGSFVMVGSPAYRAPELWQGKPPATPATDVYSLGCILAEMLSGRVIFGDETTDEILTRHLVDGPDLPDHWAKDIPLGISALLEKCFARELVERPQTAAQFEQELLALEKTQLSAVKTMTPPSFPVPPQQQPAGSSSNQPPALMAPQQPPAYAPRPVQKKSSWIAWSAVGLLGLTSIILGIVLGSEKRQEAVTTLTSTRSATHTNINQPQATATRTSLPAIKTSSLGIGSTITTADGMVMLYIPGGTFNMGMDADDALAECQKYYSYCNRDRFTDEEPVHTVTLSPYWIDSTEVTNVMYVEFLNQMGNQSEGGVTWLDVTVRDVRIISQNGEWIPKSGYANHPVTEVSWYGAKAYCEWAGKQLPTEAQWEFAARGTDSRIYPWGNTPPTCDFANYAPNDSGKSCVGDTVEVGSYESGKSPFGVYDMAGNVWEWVADRYGSYSSSFQTNPIGLATKDYRVLRGGAWYLSEDFIRSSDRDKTKPWRPVVPIGFRCSLTP